MKRLKWPLIAGLLVALVLRVPSFFEPYSYADEGIYLVLGQAFKKGLVFYKDIHDNKPPLLYVTAGLAGSLQNFRLILWLWNGVNVWLIWLLARKLFKERLKPVWVSTVLFGFLSSLSLLEGNIANGELFMIMPLTAAVLMMLKKRDFLAGLLLAMAFLFKVPVAFDMAGLLVWLLWQKKEWLERSLKMVGGFLLPNLLVGAYYFQVGAGERYFRSALGQNIGYLSSWGGGGGGILESGLVQRGLVLLVLVGLVFRLRKKLDKEGGLLGLWLGFSMYGVLLSERPYPHYFLEVVPVLSLMVGWAVVGKKQAKGLLKWGLGLVVFSWAFFRFWIYPVGSYYANFVKWVSGRQDRVSYERYWGENTLIDQRVAEYIKSKTDEDDEIYVWGTAPGIYYLSERLPVGRYTVAYHVADFDGYGETMEAMNREKPKVIVRLESEGLEFEELDELMEEKYELKETMGDRQIYLRLVE